jgi:hypothetical protein
MMHFSFSIMTMGKQKQRRLQIVLGILYFLILAAVLGQFRTFQLFLRNTEDHILAGIGFVNNSSITTGSHDMPFTARMPVLHVTTTGIAGREYNESTTKRMNIPNATNNIPSRRRSSTYNKLQSHSSTNTYSTITTTSNNKWAYAFLVSGCTNDETTATSFVPEYQGFLYNIVVTTQRLRDLGSKRVDFVVFIQMSSSTPATTLASDQEALLRRLDIQIHYLPKMRSWVHETFYAVVQEKFRILQLTGYDRVLFLDGDLLPICNLDYLFALSDDNNNSEIKLQENVVLASQTEAANAGLFMLKPNADDWVLLQDVVIRHKEEQALTLPWPHFDATQGKIVVLYGRWCVTNERFEE